MLDKLKSRTGHSIFSYENKLLASKVDPIKEAKDFVDSCASRIKDSSTIFVIGLGCGYHVTELLNKFPCKKILVLETNFELLTWFKKHHPIESAMVTIFHLQGVEQFKASGVIRGAVSEFYTLVKFRPAIITNTELYKKVEQCLVGRNELDLKWILGARSNSKAPIVLPFKTVRLVKEKAVSIKDLLELSEGVDYLRQNKKTLSLLDELLI